MMRRAIVLFGFQKPRPRGSPSLSTTRTHCPGCKPGGKSGAETIVRKIQGCGEPRRALSRTTGLGSLGSLVFRGSEDRVDERRDRGAFGEEDEPGDAEERDEERREPPLLLLLEEEP